MDLFLFFKVFYFKSFKFEGLQEQIGSPFKTIMSFWLHLLYRFEYYNGQVN